jgi:hypothetical protein
MQDALKSHRAIAQITVAPSASPGILPRAWSCELLPTVWFLQFFGRASFEASYNQGADLIEPPRFLIRKELTL